MIGMALSTLVLAQASVPEVALRPGLVIRESCRVKPGTYWIKSVGEQLNQAAIRIEGNNIQVDMAGVVLEGTPPTTEPDERKGLGIAIVGDKVVLKGGRIRGYKVGLWVNNCNGLQLRGVDASYNWKQKLRSTPLREDGADWMSYHKNEANEWLRYGAAFYFTRVNRFTVDNCRVVGGQCGLMITQSNDGLISNNNFSYLSAVGLGMYRSSNNRIMHNSLDYCVRGYSHGVYNRGQDSTGILIYEQSHNNIFAYNSATHGGDGFFLWAGQTTMDTGHGGCNDNLLFANDFSHSPANAIEATFSSNNFIYNLLLESWHGIWGGFSYRSLILENVFGGNGEALAIEHGQENVIAYNHFYRDTMGVYLWQNDNPPDPNWGYPKHRDTRNQGNLILGNLFDGLAGPAVLVRTGEDIKIHDNQISNSMMSAQLDGKLVDIRFDKNKVSHVQDLLPKVGVSLADNQWGSGPPSSPKPVMTRGGNAFPAEDGAVKDIVANAYTKWRPLVAANRSQLRERMVKNAGSVPVGHFVVDPLPNGKDVFLKANSRRGRSTIIVDEWGPYDYLYPKAILRSRKRVGEVEQLVFDLKGPAGKAIVKKSAGLRMVSEQTQSVPGQFIVTVNPKSSRRELQFHYVGEKTVDYRGIARPKGTTVRFGWSELHMPIEWRVEFFAYDPAKQEPRTMRDAFNAHVKASKPIHTDTPATLDYGWGGAAFPGGPSNHFATVATGTLSADPGEYELLVTSDDGVAVWVDGKKVLENWTWHGPTVDKTVVKLNGSHRLRVEHFEIDGYATLKVELVPKRSSQPLH